VQKIPVADGANLAIAKKAGEAHGTELFLDVACIVTRHAKQARAATVAAAKAGAENVASFQVCASTPEKLRDVFGARGGVTALELNGLSRTRQSADGEGAGVGVGADEIADEEIAAMKFIEVFVDDESNKKVSLAFLLFRRRKFLNRVNEHLVSRAIGDLVDDVLLGFRNGPCVADRSAALGNDAGQLDVAGDGDGDAAFLKDIAVEIKLGALLGMIAAGQTTENGRRGVGFVPLAQP